MYKRALAYKYWMIVLLFSYGDAVFALPIDKDSASFYYQKAMALQKDNKPNDALQAIEKAILFDTANLQLRTSFVDVLQQQKRYNSAINELKKILDISANHIEALEQITAINFLFNRWTEVILYGSKALLQKDDDNIQFMLGKAYYETEDYGNAKVMLEKAVWKEPGKKDRAVLLGKVYIELSEYYNALNAYKVAIDIEPDKDILYEFGLLNYTVNNEKEAVKYYELAAEKGYKKDLDYLENLGMAYLSFDMNKGLEILNKVLEKKPKNREILTEIAHAYFKKKVYDVAADTFYKLYLNDPRNNEALYMSGLAYIRSGDKIKGNQICEKALHTDPSLSQLKRLSFLN